MDIRLEFAMVKSSGVFGNSFVGPTCLEPALIGGFFSGRPVLDRPALDNSAFVTALARLFCTCHHNFYDELLPDSACFPYFGALDGEDSR